MRKTKLATKSVSSSRKALDKFEAACRALKTEGFNIVAVVSSYSKKDANFFTQFSVRDTPSAHVTEDHVVLDSIREIATQWSKQAHAEK